MRRYGWMLAVVCVVTWTLGASEAARVAKDEGAPVGVTVTVTGLNYCVEAELKLISETDAEAALDKYRHALKVDEAKDADGKSIDTMKGWTLFYLYSDEATPLLTDKKYHNKQVTVKGTLYKDERVLKVTSVELAGAKAAKEESPLAFMYSDEFAEISVED